MLDPVSHPVDLGLKHQVALITGGAGGLGSASARVLAALGATVYVADIAADLAVSVAAEITESGGQAVPLEIDVTDTASVDNAVAEIVAATGRIDVLLTSHGFPRDSRLSGMSDAMWNDVIEVCLSGTFRCLRAVSTPMRDRGYGRIVTVASRAWHGNPGQANYSAAKAGVVGLTRSAAKELGRTGITVNSIAPGLIDTPSLRALPTFDAIVERAVSQSSIKRIGIPDDVANTVAFLASPTAGFLTGEVIHVSGGRFS